MRKGSSLFLILVIAAAMATGVHHGYLFGPDEPREAEIARETLMDGRWVTPHLCGLAFLEKPPLYYNLVASAYALTGGISPTVARSVSVLFGCLMLAATFLIARRWRGAQTAWLATLILLTMPRFWRYSHVILLDIAVGAFCTCALACFARAAILDTGRRSERAYYALFALFSAAAFLTKGFVAVFIIGVIVLTFCLVQRRGSLKNVFSPLPLLIFFAPVLGWILLYYREGGLPYLHEHFVNNILGRFLQVHFKLSTIRFYHTDLGHRLPWYFYLRALPEILGPWIALLPFAAWRAFRGARTPGESSDRRFLVLLLIWAFLPGFLLSFSGIKERSYILPSYAGIALMIAYWVEGALRARGDETLRGISRLWVVLPVALCVLVFPSLSPRMLACAVTLVSLPLSVALSHLLFHRRFSEALYLGIALLLAILILSSAPSFLHQRYKRKCLTALARETGGIVGADALYLYRPSDNVRGCVSFYANRTIRELDRPDEVRAALRAPGRTFVIMEEGNFISLALDPSFESLLHIVPAETFEEDPDNMLICNREITAAERSK